MAGDKADGTAAELDEPTAEWPAPDRTEEDTDPFGFAPVYGPPRDPFVEETDDLDEPTLPGWGQPARDRHATVGRRRLLVVAGVFWALAAMVGAILLVSAKGGAGGRTEAVFEIVDGAGRVQVTAGDLGSQLYRVSTPGATSRVEDGGGTLRLHLKAGARAVEVVLNKNILWTVRLKGGADQARLDLSAGRVAGVDLEGGANRIDLALPATKSMTAVRMSGGVDQFEVRLAGGTPVRVQVRDGAGRITLAGDTHTGIAPGKEFTTAGWTPGGSGVDLVADAGMSGLTVSLG
ncbi:hypothetical protein [Paractinoplanes globisporus]|uniref:Adhesin domain-containing protein n=1 Tax=Paractinoplanes globisporus TaxID=113565 RepID=A0ABW6WWL5_9ACTN|nr:hypothetical protein [Actinoplanes globisporus]